MAQFLRGSFKSGVPRMWLGIVDVRDVASAHVAAATLQKAHGRYLAVSESMRLLEVAQALRPSLQGLADKLPTRELPKMMMWALAPWIGMTREYVKLNVGYELQFDSRRSQKELGVSYRAPGFTFSDHIAQLAADGLLAG